MRQESKCNFKCLSKNKTESGKIICRFNLNNKNYNLNKTLVTF